MHDCVRMIPLKRQRVRDGDWLRGGWRSGVAGGGVTLRGPIGKVFCRWSSPPASGRWGRPPRGAAVVRVHGATGTLRAAASWGRAGAHSYVSQTVGEARAGCLGPLCALLEISCDSIIISESNTNRSQVARVAHPSLALESEAGWIQSVVPAGNGLVVCHRPTSGTLPRHLSRRWSREGQGRPRQAKKPERIFVSHLRHRRP